MVPPPATFFKFGLGWAVATLSLPVLSLTLADYNYIDRRDNKDTTKQLLANPKKSKIDEFQLRRWQDGKVMTENEINAIRAVLACFNYELKPKKDEFWKKGFAADAVQESPCMICIGRERIGSSWRGTRALFTNKNVTIKSIAKEIPNKQQQQVVGEGETTKDSSSTNSNSNNNSTTTFYIELSSEVGINNNLLKDKTVNFNSSIELITDDNFEKSGRQGVCMMRHRWFAGKLPSHVSLIGGKANPVCGVFDGLRFLNGFVATTIPFV